MARKRKAGLVRAWLWLAGSLRGSLGLHNQPALNQNQNKQEDSHYTLTLWTTRGNAWGCPGLQPLSFRVNLFNRRAWLNCCCVVPVPVGRGFLPQGNEKQALGSAGPRLSSPLPPPRGLLSFTSWRMSSHPSPCICSGNWTFWSLSLYSLLETVRGARAVGN